MLTSILEKHGGWIHRATLIDQGWSRTKLLAARREEGVELVRRQWLIHPRASRDIRAAARLGGVITSVSALKRYELWVPPGLEREARAHVAVKPNAGIRPDDRTVVYRSRPVVERSPRALVDALENVLSNVARRLPEAQAFAIWESAIERRLTTPEELSTVPWISAVARTLAVEVSAHSDSGVESTFVKQCRRARIPIVQQVWIAGHPVDALIGRHLVVQLDGYAFHSDAAQRRRDIAHDRKLVAMGYTVLRFSYHDVMYDWPRVEREIRAMIARGRAR